MHHGEGLRRLLTATGMEESGCRELLSALGSERPLGSGIAGLRSPDRVMLAYAEKLTRTPGAIEPNDVEALRAEGFDDRAIHDVCAVTAYYAFVNRIADGLGVDLEPGRGEL